MFFQLIFIAIINAIIDEFLLYIIFEIFIFKSYKASYDVYLKLSLYAKFIIICVNNKC